MAAILAKMIDEEEDPVDSIHRGAGRLVCVGVESLGRNGDCHTPISAVAGGRGNRG